MPYFDMVASAVEFIETQLEKEISVADISNVSGLSSWHFQRIFHEVVGETIGSYLRRRRLACAFEKLVGDAAPKVIDVALDYQFGSPEAFSRSFKSEFGFSPQQLRKSGIKILPFKRPTLSRRQIHYLMHDLKMNPVIQEVAPFLVVGAPVSVVSPFAKRLEYMDLILDVWKKFHLQENKISYALGAIKVGVIDGLAPSHHIHDDMVDYLACTPVSQIDDVPVGFRSYQVPGGTYAVFKGTGFHEQTQFMIDHVYSAWLPHSEYVRSEGPEFTLLDHRTMPLDPVTSEVEYYLPIKRK